MAPNNNRNVWSSNFPRKFLVHAHIYGAYAHCQFVIMARLPATMAHPVLLYTTGTSNAELLLPPTTILISVQQLQNKGIKNGCRRVQGRSQGTTLSASDLHNARATILNPFYNMDYKIIKKIRQNTAWIEADILAKNLTPNRCNALAPAIVYVGNDVTIPFNSVTSQ